MTFLLTRGPCVTGLSAFKVIHDVDEKLTKALLQSPLSDMNNAQHLVLITSQLCNQSTNVCAILVSWKAEVSAALLMVFVTAQLAKKNSISFQMTVTKLLIKHWSCSRQWRLCAYLFTRRHGTHQRPQEREIEKKMSSRCSAELSVREHEFL